MDVRDLRAFVAVLDEGAFTGAAQRLGIARATLSERIRKLENEVGAQLVTRLPVTPTAAGAVFEPHARRALADVDAALDAVARTARPRIPVLRVGHLTSGAADLNRPIYAALTRALPEFKIQIVELTLAAADTAVIDGHVDVAFVRDPVDDPRLQASALYRTGRVAAIADRHPLAGRHSLTVSEIADVPITAVNRHQHPAIQRVYALQDERNGDPPRVLESITLSEAIVHVLVRGAVAVPSAGSARFLAIPGVRFIPVTDARPSGPVAVCRRDDRRPAVRTFMEIAAHIAATCRALIPDAVAQEHLL